MAALVTEVCHKSFDVAIIGAGLSGLVAAYTLLMNSNKILKIAFIDSRPNAGGRLRSIRGIDIGGAWTWPSDINLHNLAKELEIDTIPQQWKGLDVYTQGRSYSQLQHDYRKSRSGELSPCGIDARRFKGGTSNLINKLIEKINQYPGIEFIFDTSVIEIILSNESSNIDSSISNSELITKPTNIKVINNNIIDTYNINSAIIIAMPPQSISNIKFSPILPLSTQKIMKSTQTWMFGTVKAIIIYKNQWWKDESLKDKLSAA
jgi:monoamine oxidase